MQREVESSTAAPATATARPGRGRKLLRAALVLVAVLVIIHLSLPFAIRVYVRHTLNKIPGYRAEVGVVILNLFRGAYQVRDLKLEKTSGAVPVPFFDARVVDLSVQWKELVHGAVVATIHLDHPRLNFVNGPSSAQSQTGISKSWMRRVKELFPLEINHVTVVDGEIHFRDFYRTPKVDLYLRDLQARAANLTNSQRLSRSLVATIEVRGRVGEQGRLYVRLETDPFTVKPTFKLNAQLVDVNLPDWNDFLRAYGNFDVKRGTFSVASEVAVDRGKLAGYLKPVFRQVQVAYWRDIKGNPLRAAWEMIVAGVAELLTNQPKDQIATRIPLQGDIGRPDMDLWSTIGGLLRNAYIQAVFPGLENSVHLKQQ